MDGGGAAPHDEHAHAAEVLAARVGDGVPLLPGEVALARVGRDEGVGPRPRRVDEGAGDPGPLCSVHVEHAADVGDPVDPDRAEHRQVVGLLVVVEPPGDDLVGTVVRVARGSGVGQVGDAVHVGHRQRVPAVLPGAAGVLVGVEHDVVDTEPTQVVARREPGLTGTDDEGVEGGHAASNAGAAALDPRLRDCRP